MSASNFSSEAIKRKLDSEGRQHGMEEAGAEQCSFVKETRWASDEEQCVTRRREQESLQGLSVMKCLKSLGVSSELSPNSLI